MAVTQATECSTAARRIDHPGAVLCMVDLRVKLNAIKAPGCVGDGHIGAVVAVSGEGKARGHHGHVVPMAHPGCSLCGQALENLTAGVVVGTGLTVLPGGVLLGRGNLSAQGMRHELASIADRSPPGKWRRPPAGYRPSP